MKKSLFLSLLFLSFVFAFFTFLIKPASAIIPITDGGYTSCPSNLPNCGTSPGNCYTMNNKLCHSSCGSSCQCVGNSNTQSWAKYVPVCALVNPTTCAWRYLYSTAACSTADKCVTNSGSYGPYLNYGTCGCSSGSIYKTCCNGYNLSSTNCTKLDVDGHTPYEGKCPSGTSTVACNVSSCTVFINAGYKCTTGACGSSACHAVFPSPTHTPTPTPSGPTNTPTPTFTPTPTPAPQACQMDWSGMPSPIIAGKNYAVHVVWSSNFGIKYPSIYLDPGGSTIYRNTGITAGTSPYSANILIPNTLSVGTNYSLRGYLDNATGGVLCSPIKTFDVTYPAWYQSIGGDVRKDDSSTFEIPTSYYLSGDRTSPNLTSGIYYTSQPSAYFGNGDANPTNWLVKGTNFSPDTPGIKTSYSYMRANLQKLKQCSYDMYSTTGDSNCTSTLATKACSGTAPNCTLNSLAPGVYTRSDDVTITGSGKSFTTAGSYIFLIDGNLTVDENLTAPTANGAVVIFIVSGSINVTPRVSQIDGIYSADGQISFDSYSSGNDTQLLVGGNIIGNAGLSTDTPFVNNRDLGSSLNADTPSVKITYRPDFILHAPDLIKQTTYTISEIAPQGGLAVVFTSTPTPTPKPCTNISFVAGSVSPSNVNTNSSYTTYCDYGTYPLNSIAAAPGSGSCSYNHFNGTQAVFNCTSGGTSGTFSNKCTLVAGTSDDSCARQDPINSLTVSAGPKGFWHLDEGTGTTTSDASGNGNTGTLTNGPTWQTSASCKHGACLLFDGTNDKVNAGNGASLNITGAITLEAWVKFTTVPGSNQSYQIISKDKDTGGRSFVLDISNYASCPSGSTTCFRFYINGGGGGTNKEIRSTGTAAVNTWYHVAGTYAPSGAMHIYVNGVLADGSTISTAPTSIGTSTANVVIGAREYAGFLEYFKGYIDEPKIYNYVRTAAQIASDM